MRKGELSKAKMVAATASLLRQQGYHGTGLNQILKESGAPKGSLYFHFPGGKEQLTCAALELAGRAWQDRLDPVIEAAPDAAAAVRAVCHALGQELSTSGYVSGCPIATVALEAATASEAVRNTCAAQYAAWQQLIAEPLIATGTEPTLADELAQFVLSTIEGALVLSRVSQSTRPLDVAGKMLEKLLADQLAATGAAAD